MDYRHFTLTNDKGKIRVTLLGEFIMYCDTVREAKADIDEILSGKADKQWLKLH